MLRASRSVAVAARRLAGDEWRLLQRLLARLLWLLPLLLLLTLTLAATALYAGFRLLLWLSGSAALSILVVLGVQLLVLIVLLRSGQQSARKLRAQPQLRRPAPAAASAAAVPVRPSLAALEAQASADAQALAQSRAELDALRQRLATRAQRSAGWMLPAAGFVAGWLLARGDTRLGSALRLAARGMRLLYGPRRDVPASRR